MRFTREQYDTAIENLQAAAKQVEPDGLPCSVCGDSGHQAWECGHNPLLAVAICRQIAKQSGELHDQLHYLAGHDTAFGETIGPAKIVLPAGAKEER